MVKKWTILFLMTASTLICLNSYIFAEESCLDGCHKDIVNIGEHKNVTCESCHQKNEKHFTKGSGLDSCLKCHKDYEGIKNSSMHTRQSEKDYVHKVFDNSDKEFYDKNCNSCHVDSCSDCHKTNQKHSVLKPDTDTCLKCHNSYFVGHEYKGLGIRDDHERYQRGIEFDNNSYMKMTPDIHFEKGLKCGTCHDMKSIATGKKSSKICTDCHKKINEDVVEHKIKKHLTDMECYTCHSSWIPMEFGTFWIRFKDTPYRQYFRWLSYYKEEYAKSSFFKINNTILIGKNLKNKYSPIRPEFITFFTEIDGQDVAGEENKLLSNDFKAIFPHTVRTETVNCEYCHDREKTYMKQKDEDRIFLLEKDGLKLKNFYNSAEFKMLNGNFVSDESFNKIINKDKNYYKQYIDKNKKKLNLIKKLK